MERTEKEVDLIFARLAASNFRSRFKLRGKERSYLESKGLAAIETHARDFVTQRLAPAMPENDGKQTPMKNHPVFIAQHATATCCRGCMEKWHSIAKGRALTADEINYTVSVIMRWLEENLSTK